MVASHMCGAFYRNVSWDLQLGAGGNPLPLYAQNSSPQRGSNSVGLWRGDGQPIGQLSWQIRC